MTVTNNSSSAQSNVTLADVLPANTTLVSWTVPSDWNSRLRPAAAPAALCRHGSLPLAANTSDTFTLVVQVNSGTAGGTVISNTASVGPLTGDTNPSNNSVRFNTTAGLGNSTSALIADIQSANAAGGATTITLAANTTFDFATGNYSTNGANALPAITGNITIVGNGDTIERTGAAAFRLFDVASGGSLTLENLTLTGGLAQGTGSAAEGGAIYSTGTLNLSGVTVKSNVAQGSNGVNGGVSASGSNGGAPRRRLVRGGRQRHAEQR